MFGIGKSEQPPVEKSPEELKEEAMDLLKGYLSTGEDLGSQASVTIVNAWDYIDEDIKKDLLATFPNRLGRELLRRKLKVEFKEN